MALPVIVKSTKRGILLVLDPEIPYEILKEKIREKFLETKDFFQDASFAVSFSGRVLSKEQEAEILALIAECSGAKILCVLDEHQLLDTYLEERLQQLKQDRLLRTGLFHVGDLCAGQSLECEHSVVVIGNVKKGAKVISKGNIVILGSLMGYAFAGAGGRTVSFVSALSIRSANIRIGNCSLHKRQSRFCRRCSYDLPHPQIAKAKEKSIVIEPLTNGFFV